jgi:hypothetical protein
VLNDNESEPRTLRAVVGEKRLLVNPTAAQAATERARTESASANHSLQERTARKVSTISQFYRFVFLFTTFVPRNNETMAYHKKLFGVLDPGLKMREHLCLHYRKCYPTIQCNCSACNVPADAGLKKNTTFPRW